MLGNVYILHIPLYVLRGVQSICAKSINIPLIKVFLGGSFLILWFSTGNKKKSVYMYVFPFTSDQYRLQNEVCIISIY